MIIERYGHILEENRRNTSRRIEELFYQRPIANINEVELKTIHLGVASGGLWRLLKKPRKPLQTLTFLKFHCSQFATVSC